MSGEMNFAWKVSDLLAGWADWPSFDLPGTVVGDVTLDSRNVSLKSGKARGVDGRPGPLFLACAGSACHGLDFAPQAVAAGAAAVAWEPVSGVAAPEFGVPTIAVPDLKARAGEIAARFFGEPSEQMHVAGITGTDGKTSTSHLLAQSWAALGRPCEYIGTLGSGPLGAMDASVNTTPDAVSVQRILAAALAAGRRDCAMEVSSHALDQGRINGVHFAATVLTNIGRDHLDYHGDLDHYIAAKRKLFGRGDGAVAILNRDDARGRNFAEALRGRCRVVVYGLDGDPPAEPHVIGRGLVAHARGLSFEMVSGGDSGAVDSGLIGRFNASNLLAVGGVLLEAGVSLADACTVLSAARTVPGRAEAFHGPKSEALVVVDYAHTPQALGSVLAALREHAAGRLLCVFGCGGDRDHGKRPMMAKAVAHGADCFIVTDDNPRSEDPVAIVADMRAGLPAGAPFEVCHDRAQAIRMAVAEARIGDVVLVAGKGHEDYQVYGSERRPFSDRVLAAELVGVEMPT